MPRIPDEIGHLLCGRLLGNSDWPLILTAQLCDLRCRFIPKGRIGRSHHAIARNGRVLLASDQPLAELAGVVARVRLQTWHKAILPGEAAELWGILLCACTLPRPLGELSYAVRLAEMAVESSD